MKKEKPQSFEDFVGSEEGKKIVDRVMGECKKEGMFIKRRIKQDDAP